MVKAGQPVDDVINELSPLLEPGDIIVDGGNSLFTDTKRRFEAMKEKNCTSSAWESQAARKGRSKGQA
jgi:6-phosphogluconate dehydrogenase